MVCHDKIKIKQQRNWFCFIKLDFGDGQVTKSVKIFNKSVVTAKRNWRQMNKKRKWKRQKMKKKKLWKWQLVVREKEWWKKKIEGRKNEREKNKFLKRKREWLIKTREFSFFICLTEDEGKRLSVC